MDTLTIEIRNPKVRELIDNLAELDLIAILPQRATWSGRWKALSASLPDQSELAEQDIFDEISAVRQGSATHQ